MAKKKKEETPSAIELMELPPYDEFEEKPPNETPFDKAYSVLTSTTGHRLELMTRTTPKLATALSVGYNLTYNFKSSYVQGKLDTLMRIHVSMGGKGRSEMVQALQSGSGVSDGFYDQANPTLNSYVDMQRSEPDRED